MRRTMRSRRFLRMTCRSEPIRLLIICMFVWLWMNALPGNANAQSACPRIADAIPLVPEIAETTSAQIGRDFYTTTRSFQFHAGQQAVLSSSPDGQNPVSTDDQVLIQASPSGQTWSHDFRNPARTRIVPLPAQELSHLFVVGENTVTVKVTDLFVPNYSTRPYFLVLITRCATPTPMPTQTPTALDTATFTPFPTATNTPVLPTATEMEKATPLVQLIVVTATPSDTPISTPTTTPLPPTPTHTLESAEIATPSVQTEAFLAQMARWMLVGFLLSIGGTGLWWLAYRQQPRLTGELDVYLNEAYVTTYLLSDFPGSVITIGQRGDIALPELADDGIVARIVAPASEESAHTTPTLELLNPDDPAQGWAAHRLTDSYVLTVGPYRLTYRSYHLAETDQEETHV